MLNQKVKVNSNTEDFPVRAPLNPGVYPAVCVAVVEKEVANYDDKTKKDLKCQYIYQVVIGKEEPRYIKGKLVKASIHEKSNLTAILRQWSGKKELVDIAKVLKINVMDDFTMPMMVGKSVQLVLAIDTYKDVEYNKIQSYLPPTVKVTPVLGGIHAYYNKDTTDRVLMQGMSWAEVKLNKSVIDDSDEPVVSTEDDDSTPF